jgi:hypothetical protein
MCRNATFRANAETGIYERSTGKLTQNNQLLGTGYSGKGAARNTPAMEAQKDRTIRLGEHLIAQRRQDGKIGGLHALVPGGNNNFGRFSFETFAIIPETNRRIIPVRLFNRRRRECVQHDEAPAVEHGTSGSVTRSAREYATSPPAQVAEKRGSRGPP